MTGLSDEKHESGFLKYPPQKPEKILKNTSLSHNWWVFTTAHEKITGFLYTWYARKNPLDFFSSRWLVAQHDLSPTNPLNNHLCLYFFHVKTSEVLMVKLFSAVAVLQGIVHAGDLPAEQHRVPRCWHQPQHRCHGGLQDLQWWEEQHRDLDFLDGDLVEVWLRFEVWGWVLWNMKHNMPWDQIVYIDTEIERAFIKQIHVLREWCAHQLFAGNFFFIFLS